MKSIVLLSAGKFVYFCIKYKTPTIQIIISIIKLSFGPRFGS